MCPPRESHRLHARGFTLLEIMLAMFVLALLLGGIFAIVGGTTELGSEMEHGHERDAKIYSFAQFCERTLRGLPGIAHVRLRVKESGRHYLSELSMKNTNSPLGGNGANGLTILRTEEAPDGYLRVVLESLSDEDAAAAELGKGSAIKSRLVLLENVSRFEWRFFNHRSLEWETVWNDKLSFAALSASAPASPSQGTDNPASPPPPAVPATFGAIRPGLIELNMAIGTDAPLRFVFWVPPAQVPVQPQPSNPEASLASPDTAPPPLKPPGA